MNHIGLKIKELRKKKDLTQEKLAEYLNVSFQAISKWETGIASPDLSMIVPLARLFEVSTDELLGLVDSLKDPRQEELRKIWGETWDTGDVAKRYEIARQAVLEYPGNFEYLVWLADAEASYAIHHCKNKSPEQREHQENAVRNYKLIIEDCGDVEMKNDAMYGIVMELSGLGRKEEALQYAKQHPQADELMRWCLSGTEKEIHRQKMIQKKLGDLVFELESGHHDLQGIQAAERIVKTVIDDENYLWFHDTLMHNYIWQAQCLVKSNRYDDAICALIKSHYHAVQVVEMFSRGKESPLPYTCKILNKSTFDSNDTCWSGTTTLIEDFEDYLSWNVFDVIRDRNDFQELLDLS